MSPADRSGIVAAVSVSLAIHVAGAIWFALKPPMFTRTRTDAPIRVELVPAPRPMAPPRPPAPPGGGGGAGAGPEKLVRERTPDKAPRPARRAAAPPRTVPAPQLPRAAEVEPGPATAPETSERPLEAATASAGELGIGAGAGAGPGSGGGSGGGRGGGVGTGTGSGSGPGQGSVEVKPRELRRPSFAEMRQLYPEDARREGIQARVRLQLLVDTSGRVADVRVVRPAGRGFDEAAAALARRFLFEPGTRDGRPVPMWITLTYSFEIEG